MPKIEDELDWHIYFKQEGFTEARPFYWIGEDGIIDENRPLTLRTAYEELKRIFEPTISDKKDIKIKSEFKQGHRKRMFNEEQVEKIKQLYADGMSKNQIAKMYRCSEKTIRNYLKQ